MNIALALTHKNDGLLEEVKSSFDAFLGHLDATQSALAQAQKTYGPNAHVELEFNSDKKDGKLNCWIWLNVLGGQSIIGSGTSWEEAFQDAAEKTADQEAEK